MNPPGVYMCSPSWSPLPNPSPYHPSGSSQCTSPEHPVSCIEPGLAICFTYDIIHVSMPFSQIIPPSPSPTESKRLFYTSVSLLFSRIQGYHYRLSEKKKKTWVLTFALPETNKKLDKYTKQSFSKYQTMKDTSPRETENKWDEPCYGPSWLYWESSQTMVCWQGEPKSSLVDCLSWEKWGCFYCLRASLVAQW